MLGHRGGEPVVLRVIEHEGDEWNAGEVLEAFDSIGMPRVLARGSCRADEARAAGTEAGRGDGVRTGRHAIFYLSLDGQLMSVPLRRAAGADGLRAGTPVSLFRAPVGPVHGVALHHYIPAASGDRFLLDTLLEQPAPPRTTLLNRRALRDR